MSAAGHCYCNINGELLPESEGRVSVLDRGFLFGDSVYEVVRAKGERFYFLAPHLDRLRRSASSIWLEIPWSDEELGVECARTIQAAGNEESYLRIIVTRGTGTAPNIDLAFASETPSYVLLARPRPVPPKHFPDEGLHAWIVDRRRTDRRTMDPGVKSGNYLNNIMGLAEARRHGAETALFLNPQGDLTEAPTSNVWIVKGKEILTPPLRSGLLSGITRKVLLELGKDHGLAMEERVLVELDVREADEIFLSSTNMDIAPITMLNGVPVGDGEPGPITREISRLYLERAERDAC
ncbi:MAG: branched-chain-amino acid aminotransferase [Planctomycetota bacterium]|nr:MAG: branched-chain-amino acid aminotransferase [Planctomycetota bacterium]